uniref:Uncharacterized protein n=1 Tax=Pavo cristatus TaxID=9049 RepID=A0A8C9L308_PAVCR
VAEDHGLGNGDSTIDITESTELLISAIAQDVILLNSVQRLLLSLQFDDVWVRNNFLKQKHLAVPGEHPARESKVSSIPTQHPAISYKHFDFLGIDELQLGAPVQHSARCANDNLLLTFIASDSICKLQLRVKLPHLFDHFSCLKCQLVCWGKAQALGGTEE